MRSVDNMAGLDDLAKACAYSSSRVDIDAAGSRIMCTTDRAWAAGPTGGDPATWSGGRWR